MYTKLYNIPFLSALFIITLIAMLPYAVSGNLAHPTQTAKTFFFLYSMTGITVFFVLHILFTKWNVNFRPTSSDLLLSILFGYILINRYFLQYNHDLSFRFYELLGLGVFYVVIRLTSTKYIPWFLLALVAGGFLQSIYGNLQLYGFYPSFHSGFATTGSFFNPGPYAGYLVSALPVALGVWLFRKRLWPGSGQDFTPAFKNRFFAGTGFISSAAILLVLPASQSRAALLAAAASSGYLMFHRFGGAEFLSRQLTTLAKKGIAISVAAVILMGGMTAIYSLKKDSADGRLLIWKAASLMIQDQPLTGLGFDRFRAGYMNAQAAYFQNNPEHPAVVLAADNDYAFNELLQFTAEQGMVGLALLILLGVLIVRTTDQANTVWLIISKAGILSVFVFSLFSYPLQILPIKINIVLFLAIITSFGKPLPVKRLFFVFPDSQPWIKGLVLVFVFTSAAFGTLHLNELRSASKSWKLGLDLYNSGNILQGVLSYERAEPVFNRNGDFLMNYGKALSVAGDHERAVTILQEAERHLNNTIIQTALGDSYKALKIYHKAETAYLMAVHMLPDRFYPKYLLAILYEETGTNENALQLAHELIQKEPRIPSTAVNEIKQEMRQLEERILAGISTNR